MATDLYNAPRRRFLMAGGLAALAGAVPAVVIVIAVRSAESTDEQAMRWIARAHAAGLDPFVIIRPDGQCSLVASQSHDADDDPAAPRSARDNRWHRAIADALIRANRCHRAAQLLKDFEDKIGG